MKVILNITKIDARGFRECPSGIVTKPPKPGFVGFGSTYLGDYQKFLGEIFLGFAGVVGLYRGGIFLRSALVVIAVL